jgi:dihydropteroate synthase
VNYDKMPVKISDTEFSQPVIMGILNVTPDSFSDGGIYYDKKTAVEYALKMFDKGADIVDVGGESTRPGADPVSEEEEIRRVIPVIEDILKRKPSSVISIDTTKSYVAHKACEAGARIINDISGLTFNPAIAEVAAEHSASLVIMHIKGKPKDMQINPVYDDLIFEIFEFLYNQTKKAKSSGAEKIIIDPGIGFGKKIDNNFEILRRLSDFKCLGCPILIGLSRKSFLGKTLNLDLNERDTVTSVAEALAIRNGAKIIRTHNVVNAVQTRDLLKYFYQN